jgi:hypothetical protein
MLIQCLVDITIPGTIEKATENTLLLHLKSDLESKGIKCNFIDTVAGWGCLDQDWLEFECLVDTSWEWCRLSVFDQDTMEKYRGLMHAGKLIMMVHHRDENGKLIPHH